MILGILSDSHGRAQITKRAVALLVDRGADQLVYCGDVGSEMVLQELLLKPALLVWGNCDYDRAPMKRFAQALGITVADGHGELSCSRGRIGVFHGHEIEFESAIHSGQYCYLLHGHSHLCRDERIGKTRVINPGALHRAATKTVALLNTESDQLEFLVV